MLYSIGEFAALTQLGIHTLRYYEQENLINPARNNGNRRVYSDKDLAWIEFIKRLKATDMPLKQIKHYARLRAEGDTTLLPRLELLLQHRERLIAQINALKEHQSKLDEKIEFYRRAIEASES
ncbi:MerR family transcriptional regulator [Pasteurellaceae bacterium LIM206]|nr:MerR family transcriptional regulator [Pasteurellaceae bacterium LIM206]